MDDKRAAILKATISLISTHGFHATPMSMIAKEAAVGAGTIYRYFDSKEALIEELFLEVKAQFSQTILAGVSMDAPTEQVFRQVWLNTFNYCIRNPQEMAFMEQYHNSPFQTAEIEAQSMQYLAPVVGSLQAAVERGEVKDLPFEVLTIFAYDVTVALAKRHIAGTLEMDTDMLELAVQACWNAIKAS